MAGDGGFHLGAIDVLTTTDDHILDAVAHVHEAVLIHEAAVTGVHPAVADRLGGGFWLVPVTEHDVGATHHDFANGAARHFTVLAIDDAHFHTERRQPGGVHLATVVVFIAVILGEQECRDRCQLGHPITLAQASRREGFSGALEQRWRDR
ncbi:hypothetical protein D3C76_1329540 [compost metagenome]